MLMVTECNYTSMISVITCAGIAGEGEVGEDALPVTLEGF